MNPSTIKQFLLILIFALYSFAIADPPQLGKDNVDAVIQAMTLEEKAALVIGAGMNYPGMPEDRQGPAIGETTKEVPGVAGTTFGIPRLGIPSIVLADGPAGLRIQPYRNQDSTQSYYCTAFPIATLLASTWDTDLVEQVGKAIGEELLAYGVDVLLAPALNIHRNPLGGRNFEYYSEDPLVAGQMTAAAVNGVQSQGVGTSIKHFVANNHEWDRGVINVIMSQRALREIYLRGFEIAVRDAQPWTVMSSYNKLNGTYTSESKGLLTDILRNDWGFQGLVMTDWFGGRDAVAQMKAGNDLLMPGTSRQYKTILEAVQNGQLEESILDRNVKHILNIVLKSPSFRGIEATNRPDLKAHAALCRSAGAAGMVLLKNLENTLPLKSKQSVAVFGNKAYEVITGGTGSGDVNEAYSVSLIEGLKQANVAFDENLSSSYQTYLADEKAKQPPRHDPFRLPPSIAERQMTIDEIKKASQATNCAVITIGRNSGEFADRKLEDDFLLSDVEKALIQNVSDIYHGQNKKVIIVLNVGGVIETVNWREHADAILLAWQPGQEAGNAIGDVLTGKVNPSGKLATTFPIHYDDILSSKNFPGKVVQGPDPNDHSFMRGDRAAEVEYLDDIWVGYRYLNTEKVDVAYPFGFGLSYTQFEYSDASLRSDTFDESIDATIKIKNTGDIAGEEVVQIYISAPGITMRKPAMELKAFDKTQILQPGDSETLKFTLDAKDLASFSEEKSAWVVESGEYTIQIGASSRDIQSSLKFSVPGEMIAEKVSDVLAPNRDLTGIAE